MQGEKLKYSEHFMKHAGGEAGCGFNARIMGHSHQEAMSQIVHGYVERAYGWHLADNMASAGKLYAVHNFHNSHECSGHAFPYGGTFVCNTCDRSNLAKDWWGIKCFPDGDAWCCVGLEFEDLQTSDCYAFGSTYDEAIKNYGDLMISRASALSTPFKETSDAG